MYYELRYCKETLELTIKTNKSKFYNGYEEVRPNVFYYNTYYYISEDRKALKVFAEGLKDEWLAEAINRLDKLEKLKVKIKY